MNPVTTPLIEAALNGFIHNNKESYSREPGPGFGYSRFEALTYRTKQMVRKHLLHLDNYKSLENLLDQIPTATLR